MASELEELRERLGEQISDPENSVVASLVLSGVIVQIDEMLAAREPATEESSAPQSDTESMASLLRCIAEDFCDQGKYKRLAVAILKHARAIARAEIAAAKVTSCGWGEPGDYKLVPGDS